MSPFKIVTQETRDASAIPRTIVQRSMLFMQA